VVRLGIRTPEETTVSATVAGELLHLYVAPGDQVKPGQLLFSIDSQTYEIAAQRALTAQALATLHLSAEQSSLQTMSDLLVQDKLARATFEAQRVNVKERELEVVSARTDNLSAGFELKQTSGRAPTCGRVEAVLKPIGTWLNPGDAVVTLAGGC
jgi:multidrug resistance efflux pump